jgi:hypothetical protein
MTVHHPMRRLLARICSAETMTRVVDPTLADIRWEQHRARWRGYVSLASALTLHAVASFPGSVSRVCSDDDHAMPRVALFSIGAAGIAALPLIALPSLRFSLSLTAAASPGWLVLTLMPGALVLTLPAALLIAVPLAVRRSEPTTRLIRRVVLLSALYAGVTYGLLRWVVPSANQAFRVAASGISELPRGLNEKPFSRIKDEIKRLRTFHGSETIVRQLEVEYEVRLALVAAAVPLGLAALGVALTPLGRTRPMLIGGASLGLYILLILPVEAQIVVFVLRRTSLPATPVAWLPNAVLVFVAGVLFATRRSPQPPTPPGSRPPTSLAV